MKQREGFYPTPATAELSVLRDFHRAYQLQAMADAADDARKKASRLRGPEADELEAIAGGLDAQREQLRRGPL